MRQDTEQNKGSTAISASPLSLTLAARFDFQPVPGVKRKLWRKDDDHAAVSDASFASVRENVMKRDNHTCRFCGFKAAKYQEVHHVDDDHSNNDPSNLLTICNLCHQVHHLGMCGMRNGGFFASIPELTQSEVNHIVRAYFVTQMMQTNQNTKDRLTGLYAIFRSRSDMLKEAFKLDISSPLLFAEILSTCDDQMYSARAKIMESLRLVPTQEAFNVDQLKYYAVNMAQKFNPTSWPALSSQLAG